MRRLTWVTLILSCGAPAEPSSPFVEGFSPPTLAANHRRYITPIVRDLAPGTDEMWCQWLAPPAEADYDVVDLRGAQSPGGHHVILYATSAAAPVGTSRPCADADLVSVRFLGGIGGEGVTTDQGLPDGFVYRIPKGFALMANTHYTNTRSSPLDGQSVIDIETSEPDPTRKVASLFTNIDVDVDLPPKRASSLVVECTAQADLSFFWFANHMHERGTSAKSVVVRSDGTEALLREDSTWEREMAFRPRMTAWPTDAPFVLRAGDTIRTECRWNNEDSEPIAFPTEMCVGFGFYIGSGLEIDCIKGQWGS